MKPEKPTQNISSSERDQLILEHVARYRMTTLDAIRRVVLQFLTLVAAGEAK